MLLRLEPGRLFLSGVSAAFGQAQSVAARDWPTATGWLLSLDPKSLNDCCDREQTVKNITGRFLNRKN
ncbi:hypothetical protein [Acidovorax sp. 56]|uniref:hypothetical protein n=1 Tax=Acidovorax sp. 56 TaxID=2035205 RepID=UPI001178B260|nr:hypothetical protein [Acidovorax sp. 56]